MNVPTLGESPWSDVRSNSPGIHTPKSEEVPKVEDSTPQPQSPAATSKPAAVRTPGGRSRGPRRATPAAPTRLETVDDSLGPLGPLGASADSIEPEDPEPPALPQKEDVAPVKRPIATPVSSYRSEDAGSTSSRPTSASSRTGQQQQQQPRQTQPSLSVEQAARPTFYITVGDPHKVGDLTSSYTVYQVRTKTTSKAYRQPEFEVSRRYRDFLWLYNQLHENNPGVIVPPPPEKQAVGRFGDEFVEARRSALERMLNKTASHLILQHDGDLKLFLESDSFSVDVKHREKKDPDMPTESKGVFSGLSLGVGSSGAKFVEHDDWFTDRRIYVDTLESQLKGLHSALQTCIAQRQTLSTAASELSASLSSLSLVELSPSLSGPLSGLSDIHLRIKDLHARQAQQDIITLGNTLDEYIRICGSCKKAMHMRQLHWQQYHNAETDLLKRRSALDKLSRSGRSQTDRIAQLQADVADAERRATQKRLSYDDMGKGMRQEFERIDREKVEDFKAGVETYLESCVEGQKELIEIWETFLFRLDADDEDEGALSGGGGGPDATRTPATAGGGPAAVAGGQASSQQQYGVGLDGSTSDVSEGGRGPTEAEAEAVASVPAAAAVTVEQEA